MITVHHLNNSRSQRVLWLLEELELPYEVKRYERDAKTMLAPPALRKVHPLGKSPVISEDGKVLAESGAIVEYLVWRHGQNRLAPAAGSPEHLRYIYWLHYAEGSAMPLLVMRLVFDMLPKQPAPLIVRPILRRIADTAKKSFIDPQLRQHLDYLEGELAQSDWFAGRDFSAADIQMSFPLEAAASRFGLTANWPRLADFLQRIHARPAYQRALERGGPYEMLKA